MKAFRLVMSVSVALFGFMLIPQNGSCEDQNGMNITVYSDLKNELYRQADEIIQGVNGLGSVYGMAYKEINDVNSNTVSAHNCMLAMRYVQQVCALAVACADSRYVGMTSISSSGRMSCDSSDYSKIVRGLLQEASGSLGVFPDRINDRRFDAFKDKFKVLTTQIGGIEKLWGEVSKLFDSCDNYTDEQKEGNNFEKSLEASKEFRSFLGPVAGHFYEEMSRVDVDMFYLNDMVWAFWNFQSRIVAIASCDKWVEVIDHTRKVGAADADVYRKKALDQVRNKLKFVREWGVRIRTEELKQNSLFKPGASAKFLAYYDNWKAALQLVLQDSGVVLSEEEDNSGN